MPIKPITAQNGVERNCESEFVKFMYKQMYRSIKRHYQIDYCNYGKTKIGRKLHGIFILMLNCFIKSGLLIYGNTALQ